MRKDEKDILIPPMPPYLTGATPVIPLIMSDTMGSYTGLVKEEDVKPVQDADEL